MSNPNTPHHATGHLHGTSTSATRRPDQAASAQLRQNTQTATPNHRRMCVPIRRSPCVRRQHHLTTRIAIDSL
ncbi:hypothetical protein RBSH_01351 [Rhodopirellula baltica SH28]|uniref:Uncharacterized protein n=1 Tax=Rhodopirellula baltica SH28 TaxID=993517 RepID=K5DLI3_RHOBT|nr:hypothetical protein RBSH_01351 [Rhodopirellula baltica SH28]